jgi:hypothetical protein
VSLDDPPGRGVASSADPLVFQAGAARRSSISALRAFSLTSAVTQRDAVDRHYSVLADDSARPS